MTFGLHIRPERYKCTGGAVRDFVISPIFSENHNFGGTASFSTVEHMRADLGDFLNFQMEQNNTKPARMCSHIETIMGPPKLRFFKKILGKSQNIQSHRPSTFHSNTSHIQIGTQCNWNPPQNSKRLSTNSNYHPKFKMEVPQIQMNNHHSRTPTYNPQ